ncbi:Uncharacterised protein [Bordetella pertussis]|nr:Uncharacterised protein [Bordetella pertussis]
MSGRQTTNGSATRSRALTPSGGGLAWMKPRSSSPHRSASSWSCELRSASTCSTSGSSARKAASRSGRPRYSMDPTKPMRRRPCSPASARRTSRPTSSPWRSSDSASP